MGQKVHPLGFRIGSTREHTSIWFAKQNQYSFFLREDKFVRKLLHSKFSQSLISEIKIRRKVTSLLIEIFCACPNFITTDFNSLDSLNREITSQLNKVFSVDSVEREVSVIVSEVLEPDLQPKLLAQFMGDQLEKRVPFRRVIRSALKKAQQANAKGIKIQISGRLNGAEIARSEWVREGRVPLHTIRADINYYYHKAHTIYGILGIKVWVYVLS